MSVSDDGNGLDWDALRESAYRRGLAFETEQNLIDAIFVDGLSTAKRVSEISGRGVGMAAVQANCQQRHGTIEVRSDQGSGCEFRFIFPAESMAPATFSRLAGYGIEDSRYGAICGYDEGLSIDSMENITCT